MHVYYDVLLEMAYNYLNATPIKNNANEKEL